MTLARQIAERIVAMRVDTIPQAAIDWSKVAVMDTLGAALAGVAEEAPMKAEAPVASTPPVTTAPTAEPPASIAAANRARARA